MVTLVKQPPPEPIEQLYNIEGLTRRQAETITALLGATIGAELLELYEELEYEFDTYPRLVVEQSNYSCIEEDWKETQRLRVRKEEDWLS